MALRRLDWYAGNQHCITTGQQRRRYVTRSVAQCATRRVARIATARRNYSLLRNNACTNYVSATHRFCSCIMTREQRYTERTLTRMGRSKVGSRLYRIVLRKPLRWSEFFGVQSKTRELRALTWALRSCARKSLNGLKRNNFSVRTAVASCQARNRWLSSSRHTLRTLCFK